MLYISLGGKMLFLNVAELQQWGKLINNPLQCARFFNNHNKAMDEGRILPALHLENPVMYYRGL